MPQLQPPREFTQLEQDLIREATGISHRNGDRVVDQWFQLPLDRLTTHQIPTTTDDPDPVEAKAP